MQSIYWVITRNCTQKCAHCYISSGPGEQSVSESDIERIVENLPEKAGQIILAGGEVLLVKSLLYRVLDALYAKLGDATKYMIQTNGDLLDERTADELLERRVSRIDISSMDEFHSNRHGRKQIEQTLNSKGIKYLKFPEMFDENGNVPFAAFSFWGATPELWLGGIWPRGRALENKLWRRNPSHNFCNIWSGALGFLENGSPQQEINVRLNYAFPCCPATRIPLGDLTQKPLLSILDKHRSNPVFEALNRGEPAAMGVELGISIEFASARIEELGSCCLWCDEFFEKHYQGQTGR